MNIAEIYGIKGRQAIHESLYTSRTTPDPTLKRAVIVLNETEENTIVDGIGEYLLLARNEHLDDGLQQALTLSNG